MKTPEHPIFLESIQYIRSKLGSTGLSKVQQSILERIIHSSGDFSLKSSLKFSPNACENAIYALKKGATILTDTYMAESAISPMANRTLKSEVQCILNMAPESIDSKLTTRCAEAMRSKWSDLEKEGKFLEPPIVVIGSAPTALMTLLDLIDQGSQMPSLIIGMPVGFIGVSESKSRLLKSKCSYILLKGSRGGASIASATINALLRVANS